MKKRILSVLITVVMLIGMLPTTVFAAETTYGIWVEGVEVTSDNQDNVLSKNGWRDGASVSYDPATSTLTLNYATLKAVNTVPQTYGAYCAVYIGENAPADVTVVVKGTNSIVAESSDKSAYGIYCYSTKNLTIKNHNTSSSLGIQAESQVTYGDSSYALGIYGCKTLTLDGCNLSIDVNGTARLTYGIFISNTSSAVVDVKNNAQVNLSSKGTALTNRAISFNGGGTLSVDNTSTLIMDTDDDAAYLGTYTPATGSVMLIDTNYDGILEAYLEKPNSVSYGHVEIHPAIKVTLNLSGANASNQELYWAKGVSFPEPSAPSIQGYVFAGWYTSSSHTTAFNFNQLPYGDTTIYAKFLNYDGDKTELNNKIDTAKTELQGKINAVNSALANKADAATVNAAIAELQTAIEALEAIKNNYTGADDDLRTELEGKIANAQTAAISAAETLVNNAKADLQSKIDAKADAATTTAAIQNLQAAVAALEAVKDDYATADATLKTELEGKIETVKSEAITAANTALTTAKNELSQAIASKADTATLNAKVDALNTAIANAESVAKVYADTQNAALKAELQTAIANAKSDLEALIGGVQSDLDTTKAKLDKAIEDLNKAITDGDKDLSNEIAALNTALTNAKAALEKADTDSKAELVKKIEDADKALDEAIEAVQKNLDDAKAEIDKAIADGDTALDEKISNLNIALNNAIAVLEQAGTDNKAELVKKIEEADVSLQAAIDKVASDLAKAQKDLADAIATGDADLSSRIHSVSASLSAAKTALEKADADNKAALEAKIEAAESTLDAAIKAVQKNLDDAKAELNKAIADGDTALDGKISALNEALATANAALEATDSTNKSELITKIDEADAALKAAIDALSNELNATNEKVSELETFIIIVCVISGVAFCGCGTLAVFYIIDKKKKI